MANLKISAATLNPSPAGTDNFATAKGVLDFRTTLDQIKAFIGGGAVVNDAVQARRTTDYTLTAAFADVTLDATDVETDAAVIEHDAVTDRIVAKVTGTYEIGYEFDTLADAVGSNSLARIDSRVRLNDGGAGIDGSLALTYSGSDSSFDGELLDSHCSNKFVADLTADDFITFQTQKTETAGPKTFLVQKFSFQATLLRVP